MPMNPMLEATLRRNLPVIIAIVVFALFTIVHQLWFEPTAARYARTIKQATDLGMPLDPNNMPRVMPPRLFAIIADNSLPAAQAQDQANSGSLTAEFLGELTQRMGQRNLAVVSTDPAPTTQDVRSIQLRAHVRMRGRYQDVLLFLDDLARDKRLFGVDRFNVVPEDNGMVNVELWASRLVLKAGGPS